jgi:hypothetical protein
MSVVINISGSGSADTAWAAYTPTFTGFGTVTGISFSWRRDGPDVLIRGICSTGTSTATEARLSLPSGLTASTLIGSPLEVAGAMVRSDPGGYQGFILIEASATYVCFGQQNGASGLTKQLGSAIGADQTMALWARIPLA